MRRFVCIRLLPLIVSIMTAVAAPASATADTSLQRQQISDSLRRSLSSAHSAADSLAILYNIFDLSAYNERLQNARDLFAAAKAADNVTAQLDAISHLANIASAMHDTLIIADILDQVRMLPPSIERDITETFVSSSMSAARQFVDEQQRADRIHSLLVKMANEDKDDKPKDVYHRIADLFAITYTITGITEGELLTDCLERLDRVISRLPYDKALMLRSRLYTTEAITYGRNDNPQKAVQADRKLLAITDRLQAEYAKQGRPYRDFPTVRYVIYRRMLKNHEALSLEETNAIKAKTDSLCRVNRDCAVSDSVTPLPQMAWLMKNQRYAEAIPLLMRLKDSSKNIYDRRYYLRLLKEAAVKSGNQEVANSVASEYNDILEQYTSLKSEERMRELKMLFDFQEEKRLNTENELARHRFLSSIALCTTVLFAILVVALIVAVSRIQRNRRLIEHNNEELRQERESLEAARVSLAEALEKTRRAEADKSQLVDYVTNEVMNPIAPIVEYSQMIIDNAQGENKRYLQRFKSVVAVNVKLLQSLVADVQELAVVESGELPVNKAPTDLNSVGRLAVDSILPQVNTDKVCVQFIPSPQGRAVVDTDPRRVEIVLLNLLSNAAKFTTEGSITLVLQIDPEKAVFTVTDTGCGVPDDKALDIFNRFEKLNPDTEGAGLGLNVCAIVAKAIGGKVYLDTTHRSGGARFVFEINL